MKLRLGKKLLACVCSAALMAGLSSSLLPAAQEGVPDVPLGRQDLITLSTVMDNAGANLTYTSGVVETVSGASNVPAMFKTEGLTADDTYVFHAAIHQTGWGGVPANGEGVQMVFRYQDNQNYHMVEFRNAGVILTKVAGGAHAAYPGEYYGFKLSQEAEELDVTIVSAPRKVTIYLNGTAIFTDVKMAEDNEAPMNPRVGFIRMYSQFKADDIYLYNTAPASLPDNADIPKLPSTQDNRLTASSAITDPWGGASTAYAYENGVLNTLGSRPLTDAHTFKDGGLAKEDTYVFSADLAYDVPENGGRPEIVFRQNNALNYATVFFTAGGAGVMNYYTDNGAENGTPGEAQLGGTYGFLRGDKGAVHVDIVSAPTKATVYINGVKAIEADNVPTYEPWVGARAMYSDMRLINLQLFKMPAYTITATAGENGSISPDGAQNVDFRGSATYTITPDEYYLVEDVKVDGVSVGAVKTYTFEDVKADHTISATFRSESLPLTITASAGEHGGIAPDGETTLHKGQSQTYTITPDEGYEIADVLVDGESVGAVETYAFENVEADHTIAASFQLIPSEYTVTATPGQHGKIDPAGAVTVARDGSQTFAITPDEGFKVADVLVDGQSVGAVETYTFEDVRADHTIAVSFERTGGEAVLPEGAVNLVTPETETEGGAYKDGVASVKDDNELIFSGISGLTADDTYVYATRIHLDSIGEQGWNGPRLYFRKNDNQNYLSVIFTPNQVSIYGPIGGQDFGDWGVYRSTEYGCKVGEAIDVVIVSEPEAVTVYVNGRKLIDKAPIQKLNPYIGILSSGAGTAFSTTHTAVYKTMGLELESTITASAGKGGQITPEGAASVFFNTAQTYTITANGGYEITDVLVDGESVGAVEAYTFENVVADHTIAVTFKEKVETVPDGTPIKVTDLKGEDAGNYFFENNSFRIPMQLWQHQYWMVTEPETLPRSFYFKARVSYQMIDEEENYHGIRLLLKTKDLENSFQVVWFLDGTFYPVALVNNEYEDRDELGMTKVGPITEEASYLLEISCVGDEYTIYVDGKQALKFTVPEEFRDYRNDIGFQQSFVAFSVEDIELVYGPRPANANPVIPPKDDTSIPDGDPDSKPDNSGAPNTGAGFPLAALALTGAALATVGTTAGLRKRNRGRDTK